MTEGRRKEASEAALTSYQQRGYVLVLRRRRLKAS
jgi:hypothetical protein